jgi:hypothetical protein
MFHEKLPVNAPWNDKIEEIGERHLGGYCEGFKLLF